MEARIVPTESPDTGTLDLAAVLLVMQAGFGLVSAVGLVVLTFFVGASPLVGPALLVAIGGPLMAILCARGLSRLRRWARNGALVYEALILLGAAFRFVIDRGVALSLVVTLTSVVIPLAVSVLVLSPSARRANAAARRRKRASAATELALPLPLRPAA